LKNSNKWFFNNRPTSFAAATGQILNQWNTILHVLHYTWINQEIYLNEKNKQLCINKQRIPESQFVPHKHNVSYLKTVSRVSRTTEISIRWVILRDSLANVNVTINSCKRYHISELHWLLSPTKGLFFTYQSISMLYGLLSIAYCCLLLPVIVYCSSVAWFKHKMKWISFSSLCRCRLSFLVVYWYLCGHIPAGTV